MRAKNKKKFVFLALLQRFQFTAEMIRIKLTSAPFVHITRSLYDAVYVVQTSFDHLQTFFFWFAHKKRLAPTKHE